MNWRVKIAAKLVLARIPAGYAFWQKVGLFRHGSMDKPEYGCRVAEAHLERLRREAGEGEFVGLELGPGDSVSSALVAKVWGAARMYLVDSGPFATRDMGVYQRLVDYLSEQGKEVRLQDVDLSSFERMLESCNATYLSDGLRSLLAIPSGSVDLIWSHAVLEHVRRDEFAATMRELRRILAPTGIISHRVDLKDHLGGALNNLRFDERTWESNLFKRSGFYTNRIRFSEMLREFRDAGFQEQILRVNKWDKLPTQRGSLHERFRALSDEELLVSGFDVLLRPAH